MSNYLTSKQSGALTDLADFSVLLTANWKDAEGSEKRPLSRMIISLFDLLDKAETYIGQILAGLNDFYHEERIGWRVHIIHKVGKQLNEFNDICYQLCIWTTVNLKSLSLLQIWTIEISDLWDKLNNSDFGFNAGRIATKKLARQIETLRTQLQAIASPNPEHFPAQHIVLSVINYLDEQKSKFNRAKTRLKAFAITNLSVEEFFN